jgi:phosphate transport system substrate-binding protein
VVNLVLVVTVVLLPAADAISGSITIAGNGPELPVIERLVRAFEKGHVGSAVEIQWDLSSHPIDRVKSGKADFAVAGRTDPDLISIPIAWDGIAVVVDFANPVKEVTAQQVAAVFSRKVIRWSDLGGPELEIQLIDRPQNQHIRQSFEEALGIVGQIPKSAKVIGSDQKAISTVAGNVSAVTYASLGVVLDAVKYGVGVNLLVIDGVEPAEQTVKGGRYKLRRLVLLLKRKETNPLADAFAAFTLSKEGQTIVDEMFIPYTPPEKSDPAVSRGQSNSQLVVCEPAVARSVTRGKMGRGDSRRHKGF